MFCTKTETSNPICLNCEVVILSAVDFKIAPFIEINETFDSETS